MCGAWQSTTRRHSYQMLALLALATPAVAYYGAKKFRYRSLDQPVCGLLRREGRTTLYVQREVAGIYSPSQDCCNKPRTRLEAIDVTRWIN